MQQGYRGGCPPSVTSGRSVALGFVSLVLALVFMRTAELPAAAGLALALAAYAIPIAAYDLLIEKVHLRASTGLDWSFLRSRKIDITRVTIKTLGMLATFAVLGGAYALMPASVFDIYSLFTRVTLLLLPLIVVFGVCYIAMIDRVMVEPRDGFYEVGSLALLQMKGRDWSAIRSFGLGWTIKGFFLPQMFGYLAGNIWTFITSPVETTLVGVIVWCTAVAVMLELVVVVCGYTLTLRPLDAHIRSPNSLATGWFACLICYAPFNALLLHVAFPYQNGLQWHDWFGANAWLAASWGILLVACYGLWVWATVIYGLRWSNLTNRGIITNGPYRFTKHPDYLSKSLFFWLAFVPFLPADGWQSALWHSLMLAGVNFVYFLRAKTEELHLMQDPVYAAYANWMTEHGVLARLKRIAFRDSRRYANG